MNESYSRFCKRHEVQLILEVEYDQLPKKTKRRVQWVANHPGEERRYISRIWGAEFVDLMLEYLKLNHI